jgi:energy-coupling factor transporter ATP-binding protein EcfA2
MTADTRSPAPHAADRHDLIRVHGARVNNLKDVSIELPKRRLTVFTGVSGSGKSSLVFGTIAAESQRLINETYSAFAVGAVAAASSSRGRASLESEGRARLLDIVRCARLRRRVG